MTGEIIAEAGEVLTRERAEEIAEAGVNDVYLDVDGKSIRVFGNGMVDMKHYVDFDPAELGVKELVRGVILRQLMEQYEAAEVLGYTRGQTFGRIILPQMVKRVLPPVTNEVITLVKDTSLAFVLSYAEMFTIAKRVANSISSVMPLFVAGLFYFVFNAIVAWAMEKIEKRLSYYH